MVKITFVGDIMCEPKLLAASRKKDGNHNFDKVFENVKSMFSEADLVIANLETPVAGEELEYTHGYFQFNTPGTFIDAMQRAGIDCVSTANNHCLDRGYIGMENTIKSLNQKEMKHHGTFLNQQDRCEAVYFDTDDGKIGLICYTYSTNYADHKIELNAEQEANINLLHDQKEKIYLKSPQKKSLVEKAVNYVLSKRDGETKARIKKMLGLPYNTPRADDYLDRDGAQRFFARLEDDIITARQHADIVLFNPHVGGQFNINPGAFSLYTFEQSRRYGADAIIGSHAHIVQRAEYEEGIPCFYSLGNFSMSPNSAYLLHDHLPEYGLAVHLYVSEKRIQKVTFSILKIIESKKEQLTVYPVYDLWSRMTSEKERMALQTDVAQIYCTVTGENSAVEIQKEYELRQ